MLKPVEEMTEDEIRAELSSGSENGGAEERKDATPAPRDVSEMSEEEVRAELAALDGGKPAAEPEEPAEPGEPPSAPKSVAPAKRIVRRGVEGLESPEDYRQLGKMSTGEYVAKKLKAQGVEPYDVGPETGTIEGMGKTLLNIAPAALGKPVNSFASMRQQQLARGFTDDGRRIEDMTEDEQDYLADEAMMNGWAGAARTFLGNIFGNVPKGLEPKRGEDGKIILEGAMSMLEPGDTPSVGKRAVRWMLSGVKGDSPLAKWDEEQGIRYSDPVERRAARAAYLKELAGGMVEAHEVGKHNARAELKGRGADDDVDILGETVIQGGYSLPFIAGAVAGGGAGAVLLPAAASTTGRYAEKKSDEYDFDDDGNMYVRTERDKSDVRAFTEAAAGGLAEAAVEKWGGEGVTKLLKASVGRSKLVKVVGGKLMATEVGKSVSAFLRRYHALTATTGVNSLPEEIIEEFEQDIIDRGLGLDLKPEERDAKGVGERTWDATKDFWKPENLWKLTESMIGMMAVQGGAAHAMDRLGSRRVDAVLEQGLGLDAETVRSFTATEKRQAFAAWLNNMSDEEVAHTFDEGTKYITACLSEIRKQAKHDFGAAEAEGLKFTVPTRTGADGADEANWKPGTDGSGRRFETLDDFRTGVGIERYEAAPGKFVYRVHDRAGHRTSTEDENEALRMADALVGRNAVREAKVEYLRGLQERMFPGANVFLADSLKDAMDGIRGEYGQEAVDSLMGSDEYGRGTDFGQSFHFRDRTGKDNIVFVLDRIENAKDALDAANHEAGGHSGINLALKDKRAFLEKMDSRGLDRDDRELFDRLVVRLQEEYGLNSREDVFKDPNASEELFAYLTEGTMWGPTLKQQFSHAVREAFRGKLKMDLKMNGSDIYAVAARGRKELRKGKGGKTIRTGGAEGTEGADRTDEAIRKVQAAAVAPNGLAESEETNDFGDEAAAFGEESPSTAPSPEAKPAAKPAPAPAPAENPAGTGTRQNAPGASVRAPSEGGTTSRPEPTASGKRPSAPQIGDAGAESGAEGAETTPERPENAPEAGQNGTPEAPAVTEVHARITPKSATHNFGRIRKRFTEALKRLTTAYNRGRHKGEYDEAQKELDAAMEDLFLSPSSKWAFKVDGANGENVTFNLDARIDMKTMRLNRVQVEGLVQRIAPNVSAKAAKVIAKRLCDRLDPMVAAHVAAKRAAKTNLTDTPEGLAKRRRLADENFRGAKRLRAYCEANPESLLARWYGWFGEANPKMFAKAFSQDAVVDADLGIGDAYAKEGWDARLEEWAGADGGFRQHGDGSYDFTGVYERLVKEYNEAIADNRTARQRAADDARAEAERAESAEEEARAAEESAYDFAGSADAREDYERQLASSAITDERGEPVATLRDVPDGSAFSVGGEEFWMERHEPDGSIVVEEFRDFDDIRRYRLKPTATGVEVERIGNGNESAEDGNAGARSGNAGGRNGNAAVRTAEEARGAGVRDREDSEARRGAEAGPEGRGGREGAGEGEASREAAAAVGAEGGAAPRGENTVREAFSKEGVRWRIGNKYMKAVKDGDLKAAQRMVDDFARESGYDPSHPVYHAGTLGVKKDTLSKPYIFIADKEGFHVGTLKAATERFSDDISFDDNFDISHRKTEDGKYVGQYTVNGEVVMETDESYDNPNDADWNASVKLHDLLGEEGTAKKVIGAGGNMKLHKLYLRSGLKLKRQSDIIDRHAASWEKDIEAAKEEGYDGIEYVNSGEDKGSTSYVIWNNADAKSAEAVTYDDAGRIIPLSDRFNDVSPDIRFRRSNFIQNADAAEVSRRLGASPAELALLTEAPIKLFDMGREDRLNAASFTKNATELELVRSGGRVFSRTGFKAVTDVIREWAQDYNIRLRRLEERLGVGKDESSYYAADRSYGRVEQLWGQYQVNRVRPLMDALKRAGCTTPEDFADFGMYLVAKHGEEYNAMLAQRSRWVAEALDNPTARTVVDAVLAGTRDLDDAAMADVKTAMGWNDEQLDLFRRGLTGSSQSTAFWKRMLADRYDATGKTARFADAERIVRDMTEDFRRLLVDSGRLSPAQADTWRRLSPNYVPMMHDEESEFDVWQKFFWGSDVAEAPKRSKAYGNSEVKHAFGRETMPENPVYFIVQQYQSAVLRSADNEVRRTLANLVRKYEAKHAADPNAPRLGVVFRYMGEDEFADAQKRIGVLQAAVAGGTATAAQVAELARLNQAVAEARNATGNIPTTKAVGSNGLVYEIPEVASIEQKNPEIIAFKEDGDLKFVRLGVASSQVDVDNGWLATSDARSIGAALKKQTLVTSGITDTLRKVTGWYSAMRTAYSPTFMLSNFMADNTQAARNLYATFGAGAVTKFEHFAFHGFGAAKAVLNDRYGTTLIQQYAKEWAENGGRIGGMATENVSDIRKKFDRQLRLMDSSFRSLAQCRTAKDVIRLLGDKRYRLREFVEHANSIVEMGTRIAAYATHREMTRGNGKTDAENIADAISYSRDITVNFNRKGRLTPIINALFAFSNASVQDFERSLRAFGDGKYASGAAGLARIGIRTGLRMGAGLFVLGFLSSWLGYAQDDDEEEKKGIPQWGNAKEYVKQSQITVRFGQRTFHIPIRGLSNIPYYMGHKAFEIMRGKTSAGRAAWQTAQTAFGDVIDVIGGAPTFAQAATPSVLRPGMELVQNRSFTGSQLYREPQFGKTDVLSQMGRGSTHEIWKGLARALNEIGTLGHGRQRTSWLDFQPEKLQQAWNWLGGSVGRDVGQAAGTLWDILHGKVPDVRNAFAVSRFVGKVDENSARFYEARDEWQSAVDELKRIDPTDEAAVAEFVREHPFLAPQNRRVADELTDLAAISKKLLTTEMRSASDEERRTAHEMRLRAQWLFMDQYRSNERMDREERSDMRLMERFAKRTGAEERREKRKGQRELRGTMRKIPLLGE